MLLLRLQTQQMSCLQTQQMSCLQTQQISCLQTQQNFRLQTQEDFGGWQGVEVGIWVLTNMPPQAKPTSVLTHFQGVYWGIFEVGLAQRGHKKYLGVEGLAGHPKDGSENDEIVIEICRGGFYGGFSERRGSYALN